MTSANQGAARLWTAEERWRVLVESVRDYAIFMLNPDGVIISWGVGGEQLFGFTEEEIIGHGFAEIFTSEDVAKGQPECELRTASEQGRAEDERWHVRKDGSHFWASGVVTPIRDEDGTLRGFAKIVRDVTNRKRAEDRLAEENQRKDEFLAMLSHELRNPLTAIAQATELLLANAAEQPLETADLIRRQVTGLIDLVNEVADAAQVSTGKVVLRPVDMDLKQIVADAVERVRPCTEEKRQRLDLSAPPGPVVIRGDRERLRQVIGHLLDNASKSTGQGGRIGIKIESSGGEAIVLVQDSGTGPAGDFKPSTATFGQAEKSDGRADGGLRLGLSIARRFMEMHSGRIMVHSDGSGRGSEFEIRLPLAASESSGEVEMRRSDVASAKRLSIVLAEDNPDTSNLLSLLLRRDGHDVRAVRDGISVLKAVADSRPDAVLLDIGLPRLNGFDVATKLRTQPELADLPLIALTGYGSDEDKLRAKKAGFNHHLVKPVSVIDLRALLERLVPAAAASGVATQSSR